MSIKLDFSNEYIIRRSGDGIQLSTPDKHGGLCLADIDSLPFNFYIADTESRMQHVNELSAAMMGCLSRKSARGKSAFDVCSKETASEVVNNDRMVMRENCMKIIEEEIWRGDEYFQGLSVKYPLYQDNAIAGFMGCTIVFGRDVISTCFNKIIEMGLFGNGPSLPLLNRINSQNYYLSTRERECLYYSIKGKSAREVALILNLSRRTVEQYLNNIKIKMGARTRSEMIEIGWDILFANKM